VSGAVHAPLLTPEKANQLLEEVVYERVVGFIDLEGLFDFERELWCAYDDTEVADEEEVPKLVKAMVDRALLRFLDDPRRYVEFSASHPVFGDPFSDCELCEQEARAAQAAKHKTS